MKLITSIIYNWYASLENGEDFSTITVGKRYGSNLTCTLIEEHRAAGEGDRWFYDVHNSDGTSTRIFNPNQVFYAADLTITP